MKKVVNGKTYNIDNSIKVAEYRTKGISQTSLDYHSAELYYNKKHGEYLYLIKKWGNIGGQYSFNEEIKLAHNVNFFTKFEEYISGVEIYEHELYATFKKN